MKQMTTIKIAIIILISGVTLTFGIPFKSSFYYYSNPAVRQSGMAGVGYSLVRDEASVVLNPAILGISNSRFTKMSLQYSLEYDYDEQFIQNSLRNRVSIVSQISPVAGGVYATFWVHSITDANNENSSKHVESDIGFRDTTKINNDYWLTSARIGYGHLINNVNFVGLVIDWKHSYHVIFGDPIDNDLLIIDFGYLCKLPANVSLACVLDKFKVINKYSNNPFDNACIAVAFSKDSIFNRQTGGRFFTGGECSFRKIFNNEIKPELSVGIEATIHRFLSLRSGYSMIGNEFFFSFGIGVILKNHINVDYYHKPGGSYPNFSNGVSVAGYNLF
jgi:hypothetical protein